MTQYRRGITKEYQLRKMLQSDGFTVIRSAGSKGDFDLVAYKNEGTLHLFQLKYTGDGKVTKNELKRFDECPLPEHTGAYLVTYKKGQSEPFRIFFRTCRSARRTIVRDGDGEEWLQC